MTNIQKIIKYFAIAFALYLIVSIASGIIQGVSYFYIDDYILEDSKIITVESDIKNMNISLKNTSLTIKMSDSFKVETDNKYITVKENGNKLTIKEKNKRIFNSGIANLTLFLPNKIYEDIEIKMGAGKMEVDSLFAGSMSFNLGAGDTKLANLNASNKLKLDGGAGKISIIDSNINNLNLDLGVGEVTITSQIIGNSKIDCGVGSVKLNILGKEEDYTLKVSKGIGSIFIDDNKLNTDTTLGNGNNTIDIDGGVGEIKVYFE